VSLVHPYYAPSERLMSASGSRALGAVSMAAYLGFWAVALLIARREVDARFPRVTAPSHAGDRAQAILRERYARGEIDAEQFRRMRAILDEGREPAG